MSPEQITPGVYTEEIAELARKISGVPTSISVFIGSATENELVDYDPVRISSYDEYNSNFGNHLRHRTLSQGLELYFLNGGRDCYIIDIGKLPDANDNSDGQMNRQYKLAMKNLESIEVFNLLIISKPVQMTDDIYLDIISEASNYCQRRHAFLLLDPLKEWQTYEDVLNDADGVTSLRSAVDPNSSALYFPRLCRNNNAVRGASQVALDPTPAIAGLISRFDYQYGVWKAPAGINADIHGITNVDVQLTEAQNEFLNQMGINCLRLRDRKVVCWGARTLAGFVESEWKYVPTRRLALHIEESVYQGTQWIIFEPNDEPTWASVRAVVNQFMQNLFRVGAFQGDSQRDAFFVKCDSETTTVSDQNEGLMNIVVGFAPLKPAEFVVVTIQQVMQN